MSSFNLLSLLLLSFSSQSSSLWQRHFITIVVLAVASASGIPSAFAQSDNQVASSTKNVPRTELVVSPASAWQISNQGLVATNTPGASVTYECNQPCTGISFELAQPAGETGQIAVCLDCINGPSNSHPNLTTRVLNNPQAQISIENLSPDLHTLNIVTHSDTPLLISSVQVTLPSSNDPSSSSSSSSTSATSISTSASASTSTSSTSTSTPTSADDSTSEKIASSSSSHNTSTIAIIVVLIVLILALLGGLIFYFYRRRKQQRTRPGAGSNTSHKRSSWRKIISWRGSSDEERLQKGEDEFGPPSPMLETFRSSRDLDAEFGYGFIPYETKGLGGGFGGVHRSAVPFASIPGDPSRASMSDGGRSSDDMDRGMYNIPASGRTRTPTPVPAPVPKRGLSVIVEDEDEGRPQTRKSPSRRTTIPSIYSVYSDPWEIIDEDSYYNSDADDNDDNDNGDDVANANDGRKVERLKANLKLNVGRSRSNSRRYTNANNSRMSRRDTTASRASTFQTPVAVKSMLAELNQAIQLGADKFAWKKSMPPVPPAPSGRPPVPPVPPLPASFTGGKGEGGGAAMPMQFLSPDSAALAGRPAKGHRPSRSTDVLI